MAHTVVGLFSTSAEAQQVKQALVSQGYSNNNINIVANNDESAMGSAGSSASSDYRDKATDYSVGSTGTDRTVGNTAEGIGDKIKNFFGSLTGGDEQAHQHYAQGVNQGGALLTVRTEDESDATAVAALLRQHGAREIEMDQNAGGRDTFAGAQAGSRTEMDGQTAIPIVEEQLVVGKRNVERGGVRIYSHVVETPVEQDVTLKDERINVERRAVNRPATAADFDSANRGTIEMKAMGEEAVVGKTARVVEEVVVGKENTTRTENIHDSVRKTEVDVEQLASNTTSSDYDQNRNRS